MTFKPNFASRAALLYKRLRIDQKANFLPLDEVDEDEHAALQTLKVALIKPLILRLPNEDGHLTIDTDTCGVQIDFVLL